LYDKNSNIVGKIEKGKDDAQKFVLIPVYHSTASAQIEVTIDSDGNFIRANSIDKADALTVIPVTEKSDSRTNSPEPHPLCDNLKYLAGDYTKYIRVDQGDKKNKDKDFSEYHKLYMESLKSWCESDYSHPKAVAVYNYLKKSELIKDLISCNVLKPDEDGLISEKIKIQNIAQINAFVRFRVESTFNNSPDEILSDVTGRFKPEVWLDHTLQQKFINYYRSLNRKTQLCYLTGEETQIAELHPKRIRNDADGAKLISANDKDNYTFRGRFRDKNEAFSIGYEASQKLHNALKWIIRKQGYTRDGLCIVVWESSLKQTVSPFDDTFDIVDERFSHDDSHFIYDTNYISAREFNAAIEGYKMNLDDTSNMVIMAFDAATTGRLSITYFKDMESSRYLENIKYWHESCSWLHEKTVDKKVYSFEGMVSLRDIAVLLYGTEQNGMLALKVNSDGKAPMMISTFNRLLPCIIEKKRIPDDMVKISVQRASSPVSFSEYNWKRILAVACSFIKKQRFEKYKEVWTMALDTDCTNRSYLYGRLLAVADRIEYLTYDKGENRQTNAKRFMNVFSQRPFKTWQIIEEKIQPYLNKLSAGQKIYYSDLLDEIQQKFNKDEFADDSKLDGLYLLGYHCQSFEFKKNKTDNSKEEN